MNKYKNFSRANANSSTTVSSPDFSAASVAASAAKQIAEVDQDPVKRVLRRSILGLGKFAKNTGNGVECIAGSSYKAWPEAQAKVEKTETGTRVVNAEVVVVYRQYADHALPYIVKIFGSGTYSEGTIAGFEDYMKGFMKPGAETETAAATMEVVVEETRSLAFRVRRLVPKAPAKDTSKSPAKLKRRNMKKAKGTTQARSILEKDLKPEPQPTAEAAIAAVATASEPQTPQVSEVSAYPPMDIRKREYRKPNAPMGARQFANLGEIVASAGIVVRS